MSAARLATALAAATLVAFAGFARGPLGAHEKHHVLVLAALGALALGQAGGLLVRGLGGRGELRLGASALGVLAAASGLVREPPSLGAATATLLALALATGLELRDAGASLFRLLASERAHRVVIGLAALGFFALALAEQLYRYENLQIGVLDQGIFTQPLWSILNGHGPYSTVAARNPGHNHLFSDHFYVGIYLHAPLYALWPDPRILCWIQSATMALAGVQTYRLGRTLRLASAPALAVGLAFLAHPSVWSGATGYAVYGYHMDALFPLMFLGAAEILIRERTSRAAALAAGVAPRASAATVLLVGTIVLVALFCHERFALVWCGLGAALVLRGERRAGFALGTLAGFWFALAALVVIPHYLGLQAWFFTFVPGRARVGPPWSETIGRAARYVALLTLSFGGVAWRSSYLVAAAPMFLGYVVAYSGGYGPPLELLSVHALTIFAALTLATLDGLVRVAARSEKRARGLAGLVLAASLVSGAEVTRPLVTAPLSPERRAAFAECLAAIPADASVSTTNFVGTRLTHRVKLYHFPDLQDAHFVVVDERQQWDLTPRARETVAELRAKAKVVFDREGFVLFERP